MLRLKWHNPGFRFRQITPLSHFFVPLPPTPSSLPHPPALSHSPFPYPFLPLPPINAGGGLFVTKGLPEAPKRGLRGAVGGKTDPSGHRPLASDLLETLPPPYSFFR